MTARGRLEQRELLVRLHGGEAVGLGEAAPLALEEVGDEPAEILSALRELLDEEKSTGRVAVDDHVTEAKQRLLVHRADELEHRLRVDGVVRRGGELVERRHGVAERAARRPSDEGERRVLRLYSLAVGDAPQEGDEVGESRPLEDEVLTPRADRRKHLLLLGRAEDEHEVGRRLLDQLEQRLPRRVRELVRLVEDVDLVATLDRLQDHALPNLTDVVDPAL